MSNVRSITVPCPKEELRSLSCGDIVELSGTIYTARDAAHARMVEAIESGNAPFDVSGQIVYYAGPSPTKPGRVIGSCGPTTAGRMDQFTPYLLEAGLAAMIGKGPRSEDVVKAMVAQGAVYFAAIGGAAALTARSITACEVIAYDDLGPEAVRKLTVEHYPCIVAIDSCGRSIYEEGPRAYRS